MQAKCLYFWTGWHDALRQTWEAAEIEAQRARAFFIRSECDKLFTSFTSLLWVERGGGWGG